MLNFKPLTLEDKPVFDKYLIPYKFLTCEYSFLNLFIWRLGLDIQYTIVNDVLIIKKKDFYGDYHFMEPIGYNKSNLKEIVNALLDYKKEYNLKNLFKDAETPFMEELKALYGDTLTIEEDRANFDYIYDGSKLITLSGKKLHGKKNHYNNFIKNNNYRYELINEENRGLCLQTAEEWCNKNNCEGYLKYELQAIKELFLNANRLNFIGLAVYVDEVMSAFTIGEKVNDQMAIIHIEKADSEINGLYTFINKIFVESCFPDVPFINREQDLGKEGLRKAKLSYSPVKLEPKFIIY